MLVSNSTVPNVTLQFCQWYYYRRCRSCILIAAHSIRRAITVLLGDSTGGFVIILLPRTHDYNRLGVLLLLLHCRLVGEVPTSTSDGDDAVTYCTIPPSCVPCSDMLFPGLRVETCRLGSNK